MNKLNQTAKKGKEIIVTKVMTKRLVMALNKEKKQLEKKILNEEKKRLREEKKRLKEEDKLAKKKLREEKKRLKEEAKISKKKLREEEKHQKLIDNQLIDTYDKNLLIASIDEAGCGPLAGNLVGAVVIIPNHDDNPLWLELNDSKKLKPQKRKELEEYIKSIAIEYHIVSISNETIDEINILQARYKLYHELLDKVKSNFDMILMDGDKFKCYMNDNCEIIPHSCIIGGDAIYKSIAAASILAKEEHDREMLIIDKEFPMYGWSTNKGYGSKKHLEAIKKYGISPYHRRSYGVCKEF